jgi:L-ascorbate metabolism protein UlaG (beta-lactamase superfamily)
MTYPPDEIRSPTRQTLSLITHRHGDHWERGLFSKTDWTVAGPPDVVAGLPQARVLTLGTKAAFGPVAIEPIPTPHHDVDHFSYVVTWHGRRLYFSGDTESPAHLAALEGLDVAFVSPWLYRTALTGKHRIEAKQIVIYHHQRGQTIPECRAGCLVPAQGTTLRIP